MDIDPSTAGKSVVWIVAAGAALWGLAKIILQPLAAAWLFFTLFHERARVRELIAIAFEAEIAEGTKALREVRDELSRLSGYVERMAEERAK